MADLSFSIYVEKTPGKGEDADPINIVKDEFGILGVFDGLGGAGSNLYDVEGVKRTGGYLSSRKARDSANIFLIKYIQVIELFFKNPKKSQANLNLDDIFDLMINNLKEEILAGLKELITQIEKEPSRIRGNLVKRLPTTAALMYYQKELSINRLACLTIWAGDSRGFILEPSNGLLQITKDDIETDVDTLDSITEDPPMSNYIHIEESSFILNKKLIQYRLPLVLLVATDGCFHSLETPMHFEYMLLKTLNVSNTLEEWKKNVEIEIKNNIRDDAATLSLVIIRWTDFNKLKNGFSQRYNYILQTFIDPIETVIKSQNKDKLKEIKKEKWECYKPYYESLIAGEKK
jgi:serine/threonine protein phosphatase PrpC